MSVTYFLTRYCKIKDTDLGVIPFDLWPHQQEVLINLVDKRLLVILKARQIGMTWLVAGYALYRAIFYQSANIIIVSKDEQAAGEVLDYCRFMHSQLPSFLAPSYDRNRLALLSFPRLGSKVRALSATSAAGVGFGSASLVILDENDFHPYAEENYVEIKPMIDAGGGRQLIILSAPNRTKLVSSFKTIYRGARSGNNNFFPIFLGYDVVPGRDYKWYKRMEKDYDKVDMETRYPVCEEEAMSVTSAGKFFNAEKLKEMSEDVEPVKNVTDFDTRSGLIKIWKQPIPSEKYVCFTDPSMGKEDPFCTTVLRAKTLEKVCEAHGMLPADEVAVVHDEISRYYNEARHSYENNAIAGGVFRNAISKLDTPNKDPKRDNKGKPVKGEFGVYMTNPLKKDFLGKLRNAIFNKEIIIHDAETINELNLMIWEDGSDMPLVPSRQHDDRIMSLAGAYWLHQFVESSKTTVYNRRYDKEEQKTHVF